jgi:hypothetical protein
VTFAIGDLCSDDGDLRLTSVALGKTAPHHTLFIRALAVKIIKIIIPVNSKGL